MLTASAVRPAFANLGFLFASFLGVNDMLGSSYTDNTVATGFGAHLALPILRKEWKEGLTLEEGKAIIEKCMEVLFYRDGRSLNRVSNILVIQVSLGLIVSDCRFK
jgi:20S proteasome subunit beta 7